MNQEKIKENFIYCFGCKKEKEKKYFSINQIKKYFLQIKNNKNKPGLCKICTAKPNEELQCSNCLKIKNINLFSKSQRKYEGDFKRCKVCVRDSSNDKLIDISNSSENELD